MDVNSTFRPEMHRRSEDLGDLSARNLASVTLEGQKIVGLVYPIGDLECWSTLLPWEVRMPQLSEGSIT